MASSVARRYRHFTVLPMRLWVNVAAGPGFVSVGVQRRLAWPPALSQTRHYTALVRWAHRPVVSFACSDI